MNRWKDFTESELYLIRGSLEASFTSYKHLFEATELIEEINNELFERGVIGD